MPLYAMTPRRGEQPAKVRHTLDLLAAWFARQDSGVGGMAGAARIASVA
jgi:hypothetical protein